MKKKVTFADTASIFITYSKDEYSRDPIDSILYRRGYQRVSDQEWNNVHIILDIYKLYEMNVHKDAFKNNQYHTKPKEI
jgi:hypothetical protein